MFETNEDSPTRLAMSLGSPRGNFANIVLDKAAGLARLERRMLMIPRRVIEVSLSDIASADAIAITTYSPEHYVLIRAKAGKKIWLAGENADASLAAASKIRNFIGLPEPAPGTDPAPRSTRWTMKLVGALVTLAVIIGVASQLIRWFTVPDCDSSTVLDAARDLLKRNTQYAVAFSDVALTAQNSAEKRCRALLTIEGDTATVGYRVYKDGLSSMVQMTGLVGVDTLEQGRLSAIKTAAKTLLDRASDSHRAGNPPRRSEPEMAKLIDLVFDASALNGKVLSPAEIQNALDWFDIGDSVGTLYVVAGTGFSDPGKVPATEAMQQRMQANVVKFSDEFGRYVDFQITVLAAAAKAIASAEKNSLPEDWEKSVAKAKQQGVRADLAQTMASDLVSLAYSGNSDRWRLARIAALKNVAPTAAAFLGPDEVKTVRERALQVVEYQQNPAVQDELRKLADLVGKP